MTNEDMPAAGHVHRGTIDPTTEEVELTFLELVADVADCELDDLPRLWPTLGDVLRHAFATPPAESADLELEFTYFGYRIHVDRAGTITFSEPEA